MEGSRTSSGNIFLAQSWCPAVSQKWIVVQCCLTMRVFPTIFLRPTPQQRLCVRGKAGSLGTAGQRRRSWLAAGQMVCGVWPSGLVMSHVACLSLAARVAKTLDAAHRRPLGFLSFHSRFPPAFLASPTPAYVFSETGCLSWFFRPAFPANLTKAVLH